VIAGRVIGRVVPAMTLEAFKGIRMLIVQPTDEDEEPQGVPVIACDAIGANVGQAVFMATGGEASLPLPDRFNPSDLTIIALIDQVTS